uniref:Uncharacterized protein n=1 Tax=Timema shepardi TaxID=629360 RepID=A0A7R9G423_TIMSH|nr:unnamed protein product [Timema shepardi]
MNNPARLNYTRESKTGDWGKRGSVYQQLVPTLKMDSQVMRHELPTPARVYLCPDQPTGSMALGSVRSQNEPDCHENQLKLESTIGSVLHSIIKPGSDVCEELGFKEELCFDESSIDVTRPPTGRLHELDRCSIIQSSPLNLFSYDESPARPSTGRLPQPPTGRLRELDRRSIIQSSPLNLFSYNESPARPSTGRLRELDRRPPNGRLRELDKRSIIQSSPLNFLAYNECLPHGHQQVVSVNYRPEAGAPLFSPVRTALLSQVSELELPSRAAQHPIAASGGDDTTT